MAITRSVWLAFIFGTLLSLPFVLTLALGNSLSHDEHQNIAAGVLLAREGLLPYRDFAFFHVPYLVWLYGAIFCLTDHYLLSARIFSALFAALTCGAIFGTSWSLFAAKKWGIRLLVALGATLLLLTTQLFVDVAGHSWNQEPSVLFLVLAFLVLLSGPSWRNPCGAIIIAGVLTGVSAGFRVTILPLVVPLAIIAALAAPAGRLRWHFLALFSLGVSLGLLPLAISLVMAPEGFLFGNVEFPKVNIIYRFSTGEPRTMTLLKKLRFMFKEVMRPNWFLVYGFITLVLTRKLIFRQCYTANQPLLYVLLALPFLLIGSLAPSPVFDQYFYPLAPFLLIGSLAALAALPAALTTTRVIWICVLAALGISAACRHGKYHELSAIIKPQRWATQDVRTLAMEIRRLTGEGKVLTLAPTYPLEAGLQIYPELVTGPFAWRVAPFVKRERRQALHLLAAEDLESHMNGQPPSAILTGFEKRWEEPLSAYAIAHGYRKTPLSNRTILWIAPNARLVPKPSARD